MSVLVGRKAPDFTVAAVLPNGEIKNNYNLYTEITEITEIKGSYAMLFFYPLDFTFVCPSELIALDKRLEEFKKRQVEVVAISIDSQFSHHAYRQVPIQNGGIGPVRFTMAADVTHHICQSYGVEHPIAGVAFRATFIIDKNCIVRSQMVNDLPIGRNIDEIIRLIDAIQFSDEHGEVCPAGWQKGQEAMQASPTGVAAYLAKHAEKL